MDWLWTWKGRCFGYRNGDNLWTYNGRHVGRFAGDEVYGPDGKYLGEVRSRNRLITNRIKKSRRRSRFRPLHQRMGYVKRVNFVGNVMLVGYEEFPEI